MYRLFFLSLFPENTTLQLFLHGTYIELGSISHLKMTYSKQKDAKTPLLGRI
jgi:hypothetical protein